MPIEVTIDGQPWRSFPDDTPDTAIQALARQEHKRRGQAAVSAGAQRDEARAAGDVSVRPISPLEVLSPNARSAMSAFGPATRADIEATEARTTGPMAEVARGITSVAPAGGGALGQVGGTAGPRVGALSELVPWFAQRIGQPALRTLGRLLPGSWKAQQQLATEGMDALADLIKVRPTRAVGEDIERFLEATAASPAHVPMAQTAQKAGKLQREGEAVAALGQYFADRGEQKLAKAITDLVGEGPTARVLPIDQLQRLLKRLRELQRSAPEGTANAIDALLTKGTADLADMAARGAPQARKLVKLRKEYARAATRDEIEALAQKRGAGAPAATAEYETVAPGTIQNALTRGRGAGGEDLAARFARLTPVEQRAILDRLDTLSQYTQPGGFSWGRYAHPFAWLAFPALLGTAYGGGQAGLYAGTAGIATEKLLERLARTRGGMAVVRRLMENQAGTGPTSRAVGTLLGPTLLQE